MVTNELHSSYLHYFPSCPFLGSKPKRSLLGFCFDPLWNNYSRTVEAKCLGEWRVNALVERFGAQCSRSTLSILSHCHPSGATWPTLHIVSPLCTLFRPSVSQTRNLIRRSWSWELRKCAGREERKPELLVWRWRAEGAPWADAKP